MCESEDNEALLENSEADADDSPPKHVITPDPHAALPVYMTSIGERRHNGFGPRDEAIIRIRTDWQQNSETCDCQHG
jgi:hypothetical protein